MCQVTTHFGAFFGCSGKSVAFVIACYISVLDPLTRIATEVVALSKYELVIPLVQVTKLMKGTL